MIRWLRLKRGCPTCIRWWERILVGCGILGTVAVVVLRWHTSGDRGDGTT